MSLKYMILPSKGAPSHWPQPIMRSSAVMVAPNQPIFAGSPVGGAYVGSVSAFPAIKHSSCVSVRNPASSQLASSYSAAALGPPTLTKVSTSVVVPAEKHKCAASAGQAAMASASVACVPVHVAMSKEHSGGLAGGGAAGGFTTQWHARSIWLQMPLTWLLLHMMPPLFTATTPSPLLNPQMRSPMYWTQWP